MNEVAQYPWHEGDHLYASALNAAIANGPYTPTAGVANVLNFNADPTGTVDSSQAFCNALASRHNGRPVDVFVPSGVYLLNFAITVGDPVYSQRLFGNGWSSVLKVGPAFDPTAAGVILIQPGNNSTEAQASVCDLYIQFQQPPDVSTTTTATTTTGGTTLTLASVTGIHLGYYCRDMTNANTLPFQSTMPKVTNIAGNVVTLSQPAVSTIGVGHVMQFAANRSQAVPLSSAPTLNPGAPAIQYPWAIYAVAQSVFFDHVLVGGAWNGIYIRGQSFAIGQYWVGCLNIGLDIDQCFNFNKLEHLMLWGWGIANASGVQNASAAMLGIYYDGQTVAMNIGEADDFSADVIHSWCGKVNLTSAWSWGKINQLSLDGDNADLSVMGGVGSWVQIGECYKTGGQNNIGVPIVLGAGCRVSIDVLLLVAAQNNPAITMSGGDLTIGKGYMWNGQVGSWPLISVTGGTLDISQMQFDSSAGRVVPYITQTAGAVRISDSAFVIAPGAGGVAFSLTDAALNAITNVGLNGWGYSVPGTLGRYEQQSAAGVIYSNTSTSFLDPDTPTTAQLITRPPYTGPAGAQGKLRFYASFPTGADVAPRLSASIRAGFATTSWTAPFLDFWLSNAPNDTNSDANMLRMLRLEWDGMILTKGFSAWNGTPPGAKPTVTGSRGGNAALASLLTALAAYGLVTDSSTA